MSAPKIYACPERLDSKQLEAICDKGHHVVLTADDILTLKLLLDQYISYGPDIGHEGLRRKQVVERILKQIQ